MIDRTISRSEPRDTAPLPTHDAAALTEGGNQAQILLDGLVYTLRITRAGKLILTK
ncbi:hemin uptake protein HemP [Oceaniglobus trochenteri]|uniref:hemin uptake protein HemP n=1 Tax=Oceaniglobus trochenteri TaxID=2763260 RepID=UPI001CFF7DD9|nr:hemin uptake protein HemP [Oceaniglobus trochenteri]